MNQRRPLKELNLLDRFLFDEAMEDPENVKTILDINMQAWEERLMVKQEGIKEEEKIILRSQISKKLDKKYSAEQIAEMLELDVADVEKIIKELQKN
ncbi:MAG: hypothetical protein ACLUTV_07525 [Dorea longicatena]